MPMIFVSYRRSDSANETGRIIDYLNRRFGKKTIFIDVLDIRGGEHFRQVIREHLAESAVLLAIIGPHWLTASDDKGARRLDNPDDHVRFEIETALQNTECVLIPVLLGNAEVPKKDTMPSTIAAMADRNVVHVRPDPDFCKDMDRLCDTVAQYVPPKKLWPKVVTVVGTVIILAWAAFLLGKGRDVPDTIIQAVDRTTGERILRPFSLRLANGQELLSAVEHPLVGALPEHARVNAVGCRGFKATPCGVTVANTEHGFLMTLALERIVGDDVPNSFVDVVRPDLSQYDVVGLPDDPTIRRELDDNSVCPRDVTLVVANRAKRHVDVFLYWCPPSDEVSDLQRDNPLAASWTYIGLLKPKDDCVKFCSFRLPRGYFLFFLSTNGTEARLIYGAALYKAPFAIATITEAPTSRETLLPALQIKLHFNEQMPPEFAECRNSPVELGHTNSPHKE